MEKCFCFTEECRARSVNSYFLLPIMLSSSSLQLPVREKEKVTLLVGEDKEKSALLLSNNLITISKLLV